MARTIIEADNTRDFFRLVALFRAASGMAGLVAPARAEWIDARTGKPGRACARST